MVAQHQEGQGTHRPKLLIPENVNELYSNSLNIIFTNWDFTFLFGSLTLPPSLSEGKQRLQGEIRIDVAVRMSPQHAKASLRALNESVRDYEDKYGEIHIPTEKKNAKPIDS